MRIKLSMRGAQAELVARFDNGHEQPAEEFDLVCALRELGYLIIALRGGGRPDVYVPDWMSEAADGQRKA
jgi:hypothetical protein